MIWLFEQLRLRQLDKIYRKFLTNKVVNITTDFFSGCVRN